MGDGSVVVEGIDSDDGPISLYSTVHGAGRGMSRTQAAGKRRWKRSRRGAAKKQGQIEGGSVSRKMMKEWLAPLGVELRGAGTDESPHCYKRLPQVLDFHASSIRILHTLHPIGVAMAGENEFDPFRD